MNLDKNAIKVPGTNWESVERIKSSSSLRRDKTSELPLVDGSTNWLVCCVPRMGLKPAGWTEIIETSEITAEVDARSRNAFAA